MPLSTLDQLKMSIQSIKKILSFKAEKDDIKQANWDQKNNTENDYIKNKPFGEILDENAIIVSAVYNINSEKGVDIYGTFTMPIIGETYSVVYGDIATEKIATQGIYSSDAVRIGDTYSEFIIEIRSDCMHIESSNTGKKIIKIIGPNCVIRKINEKYLPDTVANQTDVDDALALKANQTDVDDALALKANQTDVDDALALKMDKNNPTGTGYFSLNRSSVSKIGDYSFAEGFSTTASGNYSHAEGLSTIASGNYSHAEGVTTTASGDYSHAEGCMTTASVIYSHAEGCMTISASPYQHAQGRFNVKDTSGDYAHIVGNGTSDDSRSNAHTLDWYGNVWFQGDVYVGSTSGINKDDGSKKLATEEYVDTVVANAGGGTGSPIIVDSELSITSENPVQNKVITAALAEKQPVGDYALNSAIPSKTSDLTNDSGFLTSIPDEYVTEAELTAKGYLTSYTETDPTVPAWAKADTKPTYTAAEVGALPADTVIPSIDGLATEEYVDNAIANIGSASNIEVATMDEIREYLSIVVPDITGEEF